MTTAAIVLCSDSTICTTLPIPVYQALSRAAQKSTRVAAILQQSFAIRVVQQHILLQE
jgi:hypothetical protein